MLVRMRSHVAVVVTSIALAVTGACDNKSGSAPTPKAEKDAAQAAPVSKLGDLSTSLAAAREAFNAHKGEARFLTLLSPT
jgi:hypothetical protein